MMTTQARIEQRDDERRGFTLTEIAIVLGIIGLILGAIWVAASAVYNNLRVSRATNELLSTAQAVRALYGTQSTMTDAAGTDETTVFCKANVFPNDTIPSGGCSATLINPWNGNIAVTSETITNVGDSFQIEFGNVPSSACVGFITNNTGQGRDAALQYVKVNAATQQTTATAAATITAGGLLGSPAAPVTAAEASAATACFAASNVYIDFIFRLKG